MTTDPTALCDQLEEMLVRATALPWYTLGPPWLTHGETSILASSPDPHVGMFLCDFDLFNLDDDDERKSHNGDNNAALIVAAVNNLPTLLATIRTQAAEIARLHALAKVNNNLARREVAGRGEALSALAAEREKGKAMAEALRPYVRRVWPWIEATQADDARARAALAAHSPASAGDAR